MTYTYVEHGGFIRNRKTGEYERLFTTQMSGLLAHNRTLEAARNANKDPNYSYDLNDIHVKTRTVTSEYGEWETEPRVEPKTSAADVGAKMIRDLPYYKSKEPWKEIMDDEICYIPEYNNKSKECIYTKSDIVSVCGGDESKAEIVFSQLNRQSPERVAQDEWDADKQSALEGRKSNENT